VNAGCKSKKSIHEEVGIVEEEGNTEAKYRLKRQIKYDARRYATMMRWVLWDGL
jgi:hypothetical protein